MATDVDTARLLGPGVGFENPETLDEAGQQAFLQRCTSTPDRAGDVQRMAVELGPKDLLDIERQLAELDVPALLLWGTGDQFFQVQWGRWLSGLLPGTKEYVEIEGAKLFFPYERPEEVAGHISRFWKAHVPAPA